MKAINGVVREQFRSNGYAIVPDYRDCCRHGVDFGAVGL
jgi:hypothetical protein